eukprot:s1586_g26.t1
MPLRVEISSLKAVLESERAQLDSVLREAKLFANRKYDFFCNGWVYRRLPGCDMIIPLSEIFPLACRGKGSPPVQVQRLQDELQKARAAAADLEASQGSGNGFNFKEEGPEDPVDKLVHEANDSCEHLEANVAEHLEILGLTEMPTAAKLRATYRTLAKQYHLDAWQ